MNRYLVSKRRQAAGRRFLEIWTLLGLTASLLVTAASAQSQQEPRPASSALYRQACDRGDMRGCHLLGFAYERGDEIEQDFEAAARLYRRACHRPAGAGGVPPACLSLARLYKTGRGVPQSDAQAACLTWRACAGGYVRACRETAPDAEAACPQG